jgi:hypothetical protein
VNGITDARLIIDSHANHPWGVYSGTDRIYILQIKINDGPWQTTPIIEFRELPEAEKAELLMNQQPDTTSQEPK